jgi:hypothetical protein
VKKEMQKERAELAKTNKLILDLLNHLENSSTFYGKVSLMVQLQGAQIVISNLLK